MAQQKITADQVDTLNQNTTGTASNVTGTVAVANGGTGLATLTANNVILGNGTSTPNFVAPGSTGNVLTSNGSTWTSAAPSGGSASNTYKEAVRLATTANGTLATAYENGDALDGVTLVTGDRILIKNQTTSSENGIYTVNASGAPTRATDFDTTGPEVANGAIIPVQFGTTNGGSTWQLITNGGTIGNNFVFMQLNGLGAANRSTWTPPIATNTNSFAIGSGSSATGSISIAIGNNSVSSNTQSIAIGTSASASASTALAIGSGASASASTGVSLGANTVASGSNSLALGAEAQATQAGSFSAGFGARTDMQCQFNFIGGMIGGAGTNAVSIISAWVGTTNATPAEIGMQGTGNTTTPSGRIVLTNNSAYIFDCDIVARENATGNTSTWNLKFGIKRGANAAATALLGSPTATLIAQDAGAAAWAVAVTADTTNGRPAIKVTGEASYTIRWVANIRMTKVSG